MCTPTDSTGAYTTTGYVACTQFIAFEARCIDIQNSSPSNPSKLQRVPFPCGHWKAWKEKSKCSMWTTRCSSPPQGTQERRIISFGAISRIDADVYMRRNYGSTSINYTYRTGIRGRAYVWARSARSQPRRKGWAKQGTRQRQ